MKLSFSELKNLIDAHLIYVPNKIPNIFYRTNGMPAGSLSKKGYRTISIPGVNFNIYAHRACLAIAGIEVPEGMQVDHIDRDPSNNHLSNLRIVDAKTNSRNSGLRRNNKSGITGVSKQKDTWTAFWSLPCGRRVSKTFSIRKYGDNEAFMLAVKKRQDAILSMMDFGYTKDHGFRKAKTSIYCD
jgi:hypothetical protein